MKCRKSSILLAGLIVISGAVWSQGAAQRRAERQFRHFDFARAAENYKAAINKNPNDISLKEKLARTYVLMEDHADAEIIYAELVKIPSSLAVNKLYYGFELRANGKYDEAARAFNEYALRVPDDPRSKELSGSPARIKAIATDDKMFAVTNVAEINSAASDMGIAFYRNGGLMFSSNRGTDPSIIREDIWTGRRFYDLYTTTSQGDNPATNPVRLKGSQPNRKFHEGPAVVSADGRELFFTRTNYKRDRSVRSKDRTIKLKIMHADWDDNKQAWVNVKEISLDNDQYSVGHPALSKDGKRLYFMSDMPGGLGETDIYVSYRDNNNNWGPAINLGPGVNTKGRELFPFVADDGTLYFSSDSRFGLGGLDIYSATFANGEWGNAQNLGAPLNSSADDFGYIVAPDNANGYFVSNRPGGAGDDDIYRFKKVGMTLCGTVVDAISQKMLSGAQVKLIDHDSVAAVKTTNDNGGFCFTIQPNKKYKVSAEVRDYGMNSTSISPSSHDQVIQLPLSKLAGIDISVCVKEAGATSKGAKVELTNMATGAKKGCVIGADCKCLFDLDANTDYQICAFKQSDNARGSYDNPCKTFTTKGKQAPASLYENLDLTYLEEDMVVKMENLYYDVNKSDIRPDAAVELDKLVALMNKFPRMEIEIGSHTDCRGTVKSNDELSTKRAQACVGYLISHGIEPKRMVAVGYGSRKPVNTCTCKGKSMCTEEQYQQNRRTEFKILRLK